MRYRFILSIVTGAFLSACTVQVVMTPLSIEQINKQYTDQSDIDGIIVYRHLRLIEVDSLTQINTAGNSISANCNQIYVKKPVTVPDWQHPYRLHYEHGLFESYTFNPSLSPEGLITGFSSSSTNDQGKTMGNFITAATGAIALGRSIKAQQRPVYQEDCTITPVFEGYELPSSNIHEEGHFKNPKEK